MENWKPFYIDTNVVWGLVSSKEEWNRILEDTASFPNFTSVDHVKGHLLSTTRRNFDIDGNYPYFSFPRKDGGETLAEFLGELV